MTAGNGRNEPSEQTTRPLGNSAPPPTPLQRDVSPSVRSHLKYFPDASRRMKDHLRKK
jgi:hypothetical protein